MTWLCIGAVLLLVGIIRIITSKASRSSWKPLLIPPIMLMTSFLTAKLYWNFVYDIVTGHALISTKATQDFIVGLCGVTPPLLAYFAWRTTRRKQEPSA